VPNLRSKVNWVKYGRWVCGSLPGLLTGSVSRRRDERNKKAKKFGFE